MNKGISRGGQSMTVKEAARLLSAHPNFIRDLISKGELEAWRLGNRWRIEEEALQNYKNSKRASKAKVSRLRAVEDVR